MKSLNMFKGRMQVELMSSARRYDHAVMNTAIEGRMAEGNRSFEGMCSTPILAPSIVSINPSSCPMS